MAAGRPCASHARLGSRVRREERSAGALPKANPGAASVLVDELDAGLLERTTNGEVVRCRERRAAIRNLCTSDCIRAHCGCLGQIHRAPSEERSSGTYLITRETPKFHLTAIPDGGNYT